MTIDASHVVETIAAALIIAFVADIARTNRRISDKLTTHGEELARTRQRVHEMERRHEGQDH